MSEDEENALAALSLDALRDEWRTRFRELAPAFRTQDLLLRAFVYRLEQRRHGGASRALKRRLEELAASFLADPEFRPTPLEKVRPGTRLTRVWNGQTHVVDVVDGGFLYEGEVYGSLSLTAKKITGAHRSGPLFFGLDKREAAHG